MSAVKSVGGAEGCPREGPACPAPPSCADQSNDLVVLVPAVWRRKLKLQTARTPLIPDCHAAQIQAQQGGLFDADKGRPFECPIDTEINSMLKQHGSLTVALQLPVGCLNGYNQIRHDRKPAGLVDD